MGGRVCRVCLSASAQEVAGIQTEVCERCWKKHVEIEDEEALAAAAGFWDRLARSLCLSLDAQRPSGESLSSDPTPSK